MATVHVAFSGATAAGAPVYPAAPKQAETLTSSASSQQTSISADGSAYAHVSASGGAVFVSIGQNPTAASGAGWLVADGETKSFGVLKEGDKVAVIDV